MPSCWGSFLGLVFLFASIAVPMRARQEETKKQNNAYDICI